MQRYSLSRGHTNCSAAGFSWRKPETFFDTISTSVARYQGAGEGSSGAFCLKEYRQSLEAASQGRRNELLQLRDAAAKAVFTEAR